MVNSPMRNCNLELLEAIRQELPMYFSRQKAVELLHGLFTTRSLANICARHQGPPMYKMGRKVFFMRDSFVDWLKHYYSGGNKRYDPTRGFGIIREGKGTTESAGTGGGGIETGAGGNA